MRNAKAEFLKLVTNNGTVKCALITQSDGMGTDIFTTVLKVNHTHEQYQEFLESLDFEYDAGYGSQELFGHVWFNDGTWADRYEYDGAERWCCHYVPNIPEECK